MGTRKHGAVLFFSLAAAFAVLALLDWRLLSYSLEAVFAVACVACLGLGIVYRQPSRKDEEGLDHHRRKF